jgi:hypothetical protein
MDEVKKISGTVLTGSNMSGYKGNIEDTKTVLQEVSCFAKSLMLLTAAPQIVKNLFSG